MKNTLARILMFLLVQVGKKAWLPVVSVSPVALPLSLHVLTALVQNEIAEGVVSRFLLLTHMR